MDLIYLSQTEVPFLLVMKSRISTIFLRQLIGGYTRIFEWLFLGCVAAVNIPDDT